MPAEGMLPLKRTALQGRKRTERPWVVLSQQEAEALGSWCTAAPAPRSCLLLGSPGGVQMLTQWGWVGLLRFHWAPVLGLQPPPPTHIKEQGLKEWYSEMAQTPDPLLALKITLPTTSLPGQAGGTDGRRRCARFGFKALWPRTCEMPIQETYKSMLQKW